MSILPDSSAGRRVQYAALPYRQRQDGEVQVRLITSRETRRWVLPKGWPMKGIAPHKAAAREAFEEAGLIGSTSRSAVGLYSYEKRLSATRSVLCDVLVFPMQVKRYLKKWPERSQRIGFWFTIESAAAAVQEEELRDLILRFGEIMADRYAAKLAQRAADKGTPKVKARDLEGVTTSPVPPAPASQIAPLDENPKPAKALQKGKGGKGKSGADPKAKEAAPGERIGPIAGIPATTH
ncbi:MAG: NUDIX hydrolase [Pseudomonadota bacterium]